jgi:hypothetical protein
MLGATLGYGQVLVVAGAAFLACAAAFTSLPRGWTAREPTSWLTAAKAGWVAFISRTWLWLFVARGTVAVPFWLAGYQLLGPVVLSEKPAGLQYWGWAISAFCGGLAAGSMVAAWWRPRRLLLAAVCVSLAWPLPLAVLALDVYLGWLIAAMFTTGVGLDISIVFFNTVRQQHIPQRLISRLSAITYLGEIVLVPFGYVIGGLAVTLIGARPVLWLCVTIITVSSASLLMFGSIRRLARVEEVTARTSAGDVSRRR